MAAPNWTADHPLTRWAVERPTRFDLCALLQQIERRCAESPALGENGPVAEEPIRLRPRMSLGFPAGDIASATFIEDQDFEARGGRIEVQTTFLGLYGPDSPLAAHFTEDLLLDSDEDRRVRGFLDLFHHRLLSLLYRAWKKYRYVATIRPDCRDTISTLVRGLIGLDTPRITEPLEIELFRVLRYAGLLVMRPRGAAALEGILRDHFAPLPISVLQCVGRWVALEEDSLTRIGQVGSSLGESCVMGARVFDRSGKLRIRIGPLDFANYQRFLPEGDAATALRELVLLYLGDPLEFDYELILRKEDVPMLAMGKNPQVGRLGQSGWLKSRASVDEHIVIRPPQKAPNP
ncbi:MAG: type VI secretion system baseplate subunit TssG [Phycisphaerae bacterium]|nr:type VI secretion system baseplate subunit TssG [Phycisphaerae bacterium]